MLISSIIRLWPGLILLGAALSAEASSTRCELIGLAAHAPQGWSSQPMVDMPETMAGCVLTRHDETGGLLGIQRLMSVTTSPDVAVEQAQAGMADLEVAIWNEMGFEIVEPLWRRDEIPMGGSMSKGFSTGTLLGMSAVIEETELSQEIHLLLFHREKTHYAVTLISPRSDATESLFQENRAAWNTLLGSLFVPTEER